MRSLFNACGVVVGKLFRVCVQVGGVCTGTTTSTSLSNETFSTFCSSIHGFVQDFSHTSMPFTPSVSELVLLGFHTTYNNERRFYLNNLVINT